MDVAVAIGGGDVAALDDLAVFVDEQEIRLAGMTGDGDGEEHVAVGGALHDLDAVAATRKQQVEAFLALDAGGDPPRPQRSRGRGGLVGGDGGGLVGLGRRPALVDRVQLRVGRAGASATSVAAGTALRLVGDERTLGRLAAGAVGRLRRRRDAL